MKIKKKMNQSLTEIYSKFENGSRIIYFLQKTINWLWVNYENEKMCEILLLIDSQWFLFKKGEKDKICCIHKYFEQFNNALQQKKL